MILSFKFQNLIGSVYKHGNISFSPNKNLLFSPIGNKLTCIDLEKYNKLISNISSTFTFESRSDIDLIAISPDSKILIAVDIDGFS
jgi:periodic tryptophan protein 2